jgi:hypothetical protein
MPSYPAIKVTHPKPGKLPVSTMSFRVLEKYCCPIAYRLLPLVTNCELQTFYLLSCPWKK